MGKFIAVTDIKAGEGHRYSKGQVVENLPKKLEEELLNAGAIRVPEGLAQAEAASAPESKGDPKAEAKASENKGRRASDK